MKIESQLTSISFVFGAYSSLWRGRRTVKHSAEAEQEASLLSVWRWKVLLHQTLEHSSANMGEKNVQEKVINMSRPRWNGQYFACDIFKSIILTEIQHTLIEISVKFALKGVLDNKSSMVEAMAWRRTDDKPLSQPMMATDMVDGKCPR